MAPIWAVGAHLGYGRPSGLWAPAIFGDWRLIDSLVIDRPSPMNRWRIL